MVVNKEGDVLRGGSIAWEDGSTRVARFMDLGEEIKPGWFGIRRGEKFVGLLGEVFTFLHVIKCRLDLLGEITSWVRI